MYNRFRVPLRLQLTPGYQDSVSDTASNSYIEDIPPKLKQAALRRDGNVCQCCGFYAGKYQNTLPMEGRTRDLNDLITTCNYCHQCFRLDRVASMRSGVLVYLPEITQADLHHVARDVYRARITQSEYAQAARDWLDLLIKKEEPGNRREEAIKRIDTDDPYHLAVKLKGARSSNEEKVLQDGLKDIRLFPLDRRIIQEADLEFNQFPQILAYWRSKAGPYANSQAYPWLICAIKALGGHAPEDEASPADTFAAAQTDPAQPHISISLGLLQNAVQAFKALVQIHPQLSDWLHDRVHTFSKLGEELVVHPDQQPDAALEEKLRVLRPSVEKQSIKRWVGMCLGDTAQYFDTLFAANTQLPDEVPRNTELLKLLGRLLVSDVAA